MNITVRDNTPLGLLIRGGNEYGLGIYITGVDEGYLSDEAGLKVRWSCDKEAEGVYIRDVLLN